MKVLVTGSGGQVGRELCRHPWPPSTELVTTDHGTLDITDQRAVEQVLSAVGPDVVVNAAAFTAVDRAESEAEVALAVNATAVAHLAEASRRHRFRLIHLSTDYVFDGTKNGWYAEEDPCRPLNVYGATKREGELAALSSPHGLVLRTSWVFGAFGTNFVKTMLDLAARRREIGVVDDQLGCPTAAADIAAAVAALVAGHRELRGLYHLASPRAATWYDVAVEVLAPLIGAGAVQVRPITTAQFPTAARRPRNSRLDSAALHRATGIVLDDWRTSITRVLAELAGSEPTVAGTER
jgi:dTDP-4-dehydrorhamnose reductase